MKANQVSFKSRINFVDAKTFEKFNRGKYIDFRRHLDLDYYAQNNRRPWFAKPVHSDIARANEFYTDEVRTCSAGGIVDLKTGKCAGFHFLDSVDNFEKIDDMLKTLFELVPNPDRALILGSKKLVCANYSIQIFEKILKGLKNKIDKVTVFREHKFPYSESDLHYNIKNDTWTIHSMFRPLTDIKVHAVDSANKLESCFKNIEISNGDSIHFV